MAITSDNILAPLALWYISPSINYRVTSGTCQEIIDSIFTGETVTTDECVDAIVDNIPNMQTYELQSAININLVTHDYTATSDKTSLSNNGEDVATIDPQLQNSYYAICYLDNVCDDVFEDLGDFEFASFDSGTWYILFIDKITHETSAISIQVSEA